jgi:small multidrug resistance family-3 protein
MRTLALYAIAALTEIAGCFAFWAVLRLGWPAHHLIWGVGCLIVFALALSQVSVDYAGRAYAIYGGIYIAASLLWLWIVEARMPDRWDVAGAAICLIGAAVILFAPRG